MNYVGIDIGNKGAVCVLEDGDDFEELHVEPLRTVTLHKRETTDRHWLSALLTASKPRAVIIEECSQHLQSQKTAASMWFGFRGVIDACEDAGVRYVVVSSKAWQKEYGFKTGKTKEQSIATCKSLFPNTSLKRTERTRKDDDNIADAILLAEYGRRKKL